MPKNNRRHKRFKARDEVFAAFVTPGEPIIMGKVLDLSSGGVGVQYLGIGRLGKGPTRIKIFRLNSAHMLHINSIVVYDLGASAESQSFPEVHRCGVKFEGRRQNDYAKLKVLCKTHQWCCDPKQGIASASLGM